MQDVLSELPILRDTKKWPVPFRFAEDGWAATDGIVVVCDYSQEVGLGTGRFGLPRMLEAFVDRPDLPRMQLQIQAEQAGPVCTRIALVARPNEGRLNASRIRIPLDALVKEIATLVGAYDAETGNFDRAGFEHELAAQAPKTEPGKRLPDEHLERVADVYRYALQRGLAATNSVAEAFNVSRSTAGRWVVETRRRKLLGPAIPGRAGEQSTNEREEDDG